MDLFRQRALKLLLGVFVVYGVLVATHKGEFWPFSIYPMFSKAGNPWTRAIVRDVSGTPDSLIWQTVALDSIRGMPVVLKKTGVEQVDFSNYVSKTKVWDHKRKHALIKKFKPANLGEARWLVCKVTGHLTDQDSVIVEAVPFLLVSRDTVLTNPQLPEESYISQQ